MTTFEALVSMSQAVLRARGQWHAGATAHADIHHTVWDVIEHLLPEARQFGEKAENELKRRAGSVTEAA